MNLSRLIPSPGSQPLISNLLLYLLSPITQVNIYEKHFYTFKNYWKKTRKTRVTIGLQIEEPAGMLK